MAAYILSTTNNTFGLVRYDHNASTNHMLFFEGERLKESDVLCLFSVENDRKTAAIKKLDFIDTTGPTLVSDRLKTVLLEEEKSGEVQFFKITISAHNEDIEGFHVLNITNKLKCIDLDKSEFSITNFDPSNPAYDFDYQVVRQDSLKYCNIALCEEMSVEIIVSEKIVEKIISAKMKHFIFYTALDMTMKDRSVYKKA